MHCAGGISYHNANESLPIPPESGESKLTYLAAHVRKYNILYIGIAIAAGVIIYRNFLAK